MLFYAPISDQPSNIKNKREDFKLNDWTDIYPAILKLNGLQITACVTNDYKVNFYNSFSLLYWSGLTYDEFGDFDKLFRHVIYKNEIQFRKAVDGPTMFIGKYLKNFSKDDFDERVLPKDYDLILKNKNSCILIDLLNLSLDELYEILTRVNNKVYFLNGFLFKNMRAVNKRFNLKPNDIRNDMCLILSVERYPFQFEFLRIPYKKKKANKGGLLVNEGMCMYCRKMTSNIVSVKSYCRITDEVESMEFICKECFESEQ